MGILMERGPITIDCCTKILMKPIFQGVIFDYLLKKYVHEKRGESKSQISDFRSSVRHICSRMTLVLVPYARKWCDGSKFWFCDFWFSNFFPRIFSRILIFPIDLLDLLISIPFTPSPSRCCCVSVLLSYYVSLLLLLLLEGGREGGWRRLANVSLLAMYSSPTEIEGLERSMMLVRNFWMRLSGVHLANSEHKVTALRSIRQRKKRDAHPRVLGPWTWTERQRMQV